METSAVIMLVIGGLLLWGGVAVSVFHYQRASRKDTGA
ncbi:MetS family NSS transporter small subunit [Nocardioides pakistanensis]